MNGVGIGETVLSLQRNISWPGAGKSKAVGTLSFDQDPRLNIVNERVYSKPSISVSLESQE